MNLHIFFKEISNNLREKREKQEMLLREQHLPVFKKREPEDWLREGWQLHNGTITNIIFLPNDIHDIPCSTIKRRQADKLPDNSLRTDKLPDNALISKGLDGVFFT